MPLLGHVKFMLQFVSLVAIALQATSPITTKPDEPIGVPPDKLTYHGFYKKCAYFRGLPIIGSEKVSDAAFRRIIASFLKMLDKVPDSQFQVLVNAGSHYSIIAATEGQTDLPEYADLRNDPKTDWNKRARGLGGFDTSGGEENVLESAGDRYHGESIYIHEFAHTLANFVFEKTDPSFRQSLIDAFSSARSKGLWDKTYSATNRDEYWAEGVQMYFDCARTAVPPNGVHNQVGNRVQLKNYDPKLFALVDRAFGGNPWRYEGTYNTTNKRD